MDKATTRIQLIKNHLSSPANLKNPQNPFESYLKKGSCIDNIILSKFYFGTNHEMMKSLRSKIVNSTLLDHRTYLSLSKQEKYSLVYQVVSLALSDKYLSHEGDQENQHYKEDIMLVMAEFDLTIGGRLGVNFGLYIDSLDFLGTKKHLPLIRRAFAAQDYGCFALTELKHGSNVADIETTATFDSASKEFIFNSPTQFSAKWWIGAAAQTANMAIVWAQLIFDNENKGVHVFVVELRDFYSHKVKKGVTLGDCGSKIGLNGIDNGFIIFNNYRAPYDSLLDYYTQITLEGKFKTLIKEKGKRLGTMLGGLFRGRISVVFCSEANLRNALTIAIRFSAARQQFSSGEGPELSVLDYQTHRCRIVPNLARLFAINSLRKFLYCRFQEVSPKVKDNFDSAEVSEFHAILSISKAIASWYTMAGIQEARELCGGFGYSEYSGIGRLRNNVDVMLTWEGDNTVLMQQTGKYIMKQLQKNMKGLKPESKTLSFLHISESRPRWPIASKKDISFNSLVEIFKEKINYVANECLGKLQENGMKYGNMFDTWNKSQVNYISRLSKTYGEYIAFSAFHEMACEIYKESEKTGECILKLCELYGLECLEKDQKCYVEFSCSIEDINAIKDRHTELCEEIGEVCLGIINAIASPDLFLGSSIGCSDGDIYRRFFDRVISEKNVYDDPEWFPVIQSIRNRSMK